MTISTYSLSKDSTIPPPYWLVCSVVSSRAETRASQVVVILSRSVVILVVVLDRVLSVFIGFFLKENKKISCWSKYTRKIKKGKKSDVLILFLLVILWFCDEIFFLLENGLVLVLFVQEFFHRNFNFPCFFLDFRVFDYLLHIVIIGSSCCSSINSDKSF